MFVGIWSLYDFFGNAVVGKDAAKAGQPMANGHKAALTELRGDWKAHQELFSMRTGPMSRYVCHKCWAARLGFLVLFIEFGRAASWVATRRTLADFLQFVCGREVCHNLMISCCCCCCYC